MANRKAAKGRRDIRFVGVIIIGLAFAISFVWGYRKYGQYLVGSLRLEEMSSREVKEFGIRMPRGHYPIHGIDVSKYQGHINWPMVKAMKVGDITLQFAFIKATEGMWQIDPYFQKNWTRTKSNGITRGAYHYFYPNTSGKQQADFFLNQFTLQPGDLPPVVDIEETQRKSSVHIRKELRNFINRVYDKTGVYPIIYTNAKFYQQHFQGYFDEELFWVAHYFAFDQPDVQHEWTFWQHSDQGKVNGINNKVDFNVFNGDVADFKRILIR